mmetsp:Transcript_57437/g.170847  ORF Transcript_57437/g.170847 Transcript_57437/m.170847 type:complete len:232 (+) Transcript_57437:202-897(+)
MSLNSMLSEPSGTPPPPTPPPPASPFRGRCVSSKAYDGRMLSAAERLTTRTSSPASTAAGRGSSSSGLNQLVACVRSRIVSGVQSDVKSLSRTPLSAAAAAAAPAPESAPKGKRCVKRAAPPPHAISSSEILAGAPTPRSTQMKTPRQLSTPSRAMVKVCSRVCTSSAAPLSRLARALPPKSCMSSTPLERASAISPRGARGTCSTFGARKESSRMSSHASRSSARSSHGL